MPTPTDLVTDLPADFEVFGQAVDTSMADLKGGTTGQILSKASNTDMDFTWIANDQGDITEVTATSPLTGGGTSGAITVGIQAASTTQSGAVQLTDSTSSTSTTTAATPNSVKTAYDLANAAIAKSLVDAKGDLISATADNTPARLGVGTNGQVLTADSTASTGLKWATPSSGTTFVGCALYRSGTGTISNATATIIDWNSERLDTNAFHDNATNNTRITIPSGYAGKYLITWQWGFNFNASGYRQVQILLNGSQLPQSYNLVTMNGYTTQSAAIVYPLSVGDYLQLEVTQNSGGSLDSAATQDFFSVVYLGA
mgnify:CR=1 FL=1